MIRPCSPSEAARICGIYNHYVEHTVVTFEEEPVAEASMARRITTVTERLPWLVVEHEGSLAGYAYAAPWKERSAYRHSVESTIYLAPEFTGRGLGAQLYRALITELRKRNIHCAVGSIALPNPASIALHEKAGFRKVGCFSEIGRKFGRWVDVGYWQLVLQP